MAVYRRGSKGKEVREIQRVLKDMAKKNGDEIYYTGEIDGVFGGGTEVAVRAFQRDNGLESDGVVGEQTWAKLFAGAAVPRPETAGGDLVNRCLALTASFETSQPPPECFAGLSGNFDGQGISFGALQWCIGKDSLQPLLRTLDERHPALIEMIFGDYTGEFREMLQGSHQDQMDWALGIQDSKDRVIEPWRGYFKALGRTPECQQVQADRAGHLFRRALDLCLDYGLASERAVALMFDICVQNGGIGSTVRKQIQARFAQLDPTDEPARLRVVAELRAAAANPRWIEDVRRRKLTIANGKGVVHGEAYDLEADYGITLDPVPELSRNPVG